VCPLGGLVINDILISVTFAHWFSGDGKGHINGLILCTDSSSIEEVVRLMNVLLVIYRFESTLIYHSKILRVRGLRLRPNPCLY
jgi:hypothetical protein